MKHMNYMKNNWKVEYDETISKAIKNIPNLAQIHPLTLNDTFFQTETILSQIPIPIIYSRIQIINNYSKLLSNITKVIKLNDKSTILSLLFHSTTSAISTEYKLKSVESIVLNNTPDNSTGRLNLNFNRFKKSLLQSKPNDLAGQSILSQFVEQVQMKELYRMKRRAVPWHVNLIGEGSTDAGGPGRDLFTEVCMEIMHPMNNLFIKSPNMRMNQQNLDQELLIPNPKPLTDYTKKLFYYSGVLMAVCYVSKLPEPFQLAKLVWKYIIKSKFVIEDIYEIDFEFKQMINSLEKIENEDINQQQFQSLFSYNFQIQNSIGEMVDLIPNGENIMVTLDNRIDFIQRCKKFRLNEFNQQLNALRSGFELIFNEDALSILSPWELEMLICGDKQFPIEQLKKNCKYPKDCQHSNMLWNVLEGFTPKERMLFVKFGCGRMGLPPPGMEWSEKLVIKFENSSLQDPLKPLPTSATCSSTINIPKYETEEWMAKKLRTAITFGADIDRDHTANISEVEQFT
ncbi:putative E3 ubiquitin-protein ligase HERC1 [Histomonas meleagridis]|uniref:putative E3 ubiquitin-protein ligase HERC1 n=1 Tax=Histomonas meleagridis TaxID=135588 RepID=UPI00355A1B24|nr:putative E3 ubiquitin-protein ligase HERC1 [Histomonas meleagridis]KAH0796708.1 putative E3 ubiquitin-protein ligase HERC1 [Histomonas meleagridis]